MKRPKIYRRKMDSEIIDSLIRDIYSYLIGLGIKNATFFHRNMEEQAQLYVENLAEVSGCLIQSRSDELVIDKQLIEYDENERIVGLNKDTQDYVISCLTYELIRTASRYTSIVNGAQRTYSGLCRLPEYAVLDKGFVKMITEEITGAKINSNFGEGDLLIVVAKLFKIIFGEQFVIDSYFNHSTNIDNACVLLSNLNNLPKIINCALTQYNTYRQQIRSDQNIYKNMNYEQLEKCSFDICLKIVILNLLIPKLQSLSENERNKLIHSTTLSLQNNSDIEREILSLISKYSNLDLNGRKAETQKQLLNLSVLVKRENLMDDILGMRIVQQYAIVDENNGIVHPKAEPSACIDGILEERVFYELYLQENGFYDFENNTKILNSAKYQDLRNYVMEICNKESTNINYKSFNLLQRKMHLSMLKNVGRENGYLVFNTFNELNNNDELNVECIKIPNKSCSLTHDDIEKLVQRYSSISNENQSMQQFYSPILDNKTAQKVTDPQLEKIANHALYLNRFKDTN